ncbi:MAG: NRDE family protein [Methyloprofundus sp.]|nr:NRDE family protein [Methyloprofundus sp.]MDT8425990.1 NRDE family protein [Methyloprofundus sp.]
MNRDELIEREEGAPKQHDLSDDVHGWYPVDAVSGGTWFGVNNYGLVLALLNRYQENNPQAHVSRGKIIPQLLIHKNAQSCLMALDSTSLQYFMPFTLLLIQGNRLVRVVWNGSQMSQYVGSFFKPFMITSSSIEIDAVTVWRNQVFNKFLNTTPSLSARLMMDFHLSSSQENVSYSVNMQREGRHTKSITQVDVGVERICANYYSRGEAVNGRAQFQSSDCISLKINSSLPCPI